LITTEITTGSVEVAAVVEDRWYSVAVPILELLGDHAGLMTGIPVWHIADATGINTASVGFELKNLIAAGFVIGPIRNPGGG
jgi:hypothetical protein